jgi:hypothetical protein
MFSGPLEKILISLAIGLLVGLADSVGFFYTVKLFVAKSTGKKKIIAGALEFSRLVGIIIFIFFLCSHGIILIIPFFLSALLLSMGGKLLLVLKGLK